MSLFPTDLLLPRKWFSLAFWKGWTMETAYKKFDLAAYASYVCAGFSALIVVLLTLHQSAGLKDIEMLAIFTTIVVGTNLRWTSRRLVCLGIVLLASLYPLLRWCTWQAVSFWGLSAVTWCVALYWMTRLTDSKS